MRFGTCWQLEQKDVAENDWDELVRDNSIDCLMKADRTAKKKIQGKKKERKIEN